MAQDGFVAFNLQVNFKEVEELVEQLANFNGMVGVVYADKKMGDIFEELQYLLVLLHQLFNDILCL